MSALGAGAAQLLDRLRRWSDPLQRASLYLLLFFLPLSISMIEITFVLLLIGWLLERLQPGGWRSSIWASRSSRWVLWCLVSYLSVCAVSIFTSTHPAKSLAGFIYKTLEYALFLVMVADVVRKPGVLSRALATLLISASVVGVDAVIQELFGREPIRGHWLFKYGRMTGPYTNPIDLGTYCMVLIPVVMTRMVPHPSRAARRLLILLMLFLAGCLIRTESQSAWVGFAVALGALWLLYPPVRWRLTAFAGGVALTGAGLLLAIRRLAAAATFTDAGLTDRVLMWRAAWRMIETHPIRGLGLNTFMANYLRFWVGGEQQPRYAHNCYLQTWAETGVFGLVTFLGLLAALVWCWIGSLSRLPQGMPRTVLIGLTAALLGFMVQAGLDTNFYTVRQAALFWTLAGIALALTQPLMATFRDGYAAHSHTISQRPGVLVERPAA